MLTSLLYLTLLTSYASALAFKGPRATSQAEVGDLVFPPQPTAAPKVHADLLRRQDVMTDLIAPDNTCGYISGLAGAAYYCNPASDICAFFPGSSTTYGFIGCCNPQNFNCGARVTCIDSRQYYYSSSCDNGCEKDTYTLKCTASTAPYCNGIRFPVEGVEDYFCDGTLVSTWQTAYTTYSFENDGRAFSPLTVTLTSNIPTSGTSGIPLTIKPSTTLTSSSKPSSSAGSGGQSSNGPQSSSNNGGSASTVVPGGQSTTPTPPPSSSGSSGTPIGAIVGGAVGGVAGLAIIALAVFLILRHAKKKDNAVTANVNSGVPPPTYMPPQDPNSSAYAAANTGKPTPTAQETALAGQWAPNQNQYQPQMHEQNQYPPPVQEQRQYPPPVQEQHQYPPQMQEQHQYPPQQQQLQQLQQQQQYAPQPQDQQFQPQQYQPPMQQQPYPSVAEVQGSYGQPQQQNTNTVYYSQDQTPNQHYSVISNATQLSPNSQAHLSATFPDRGETTSPVSGHQPSELSTPGGGQPPHSPSPTFVSNMGAPAPAHVAPGVEGRAEMSANMAGPFPVNAYEVPGSVVQQHY